MKVLLAPQSFLLNIPGWDWRRDDQAVCLNEVKYGLLAQVGTEGGRIRRSRMSQRCRMSRRSRRRRRSKMSRKSRRSRRSRGSRTPRASQSQNSSRIKRNRWQENKQDQEKAADDDLLAVSPGPWLLHHGQ